jgi:hypothetical protein
MRPRSASAAYPDAMPPPTTSDNIITAELHGAVSHHGGWTRPEGDARKQAIAELQEIATVTDKPRRGSVHPPRAILRTDLLGQVAGILLGAATDSTRQRAEIAADLLRDAGAEEDVIQRWIPEGRDRMERSGPAFSRAEPVAPPWATPGPGRPS